MAKVKVASLGDALRAGFVPKGSNLETEGGVSIDLQTFQSYAGRVVSATETGVEAFPCVIEGNVFPGELVYPKVKDAELKGGKFEVFADGSVLSTAGVTYERELIEFLYKAKG